MKKFLKKFWNIYKRVPCFMTFLIFVIILSIIYPNWGGLVVGGFISLGALPIDFFIGWLVECHKMQKEYKRILQIKPKTTEEAVLKELNLLAIKRFTLGRSWFRHK